MPGRHIRHVHKGLAQAQLFGCTALNASTILNEDKRVSLRCATQ